MEIKHKIGKISNIIIPSNPSLTFRYMCVCKAYLLGILTWTNEESSSIL